MTGGGGMGSTTTVKETSRDHKTDIALKEMTEKNAALEEKFKEMHQAHDVEIQKIREEEHGGERAAHLQTVNEMKEQTQALRDELQAMKDRNNVRAEEKSVDSGVYQEFAELKQHVSDMIERTEQLRKQIANEKEVVNLEAVQKTIQNGQAQLTAMREVENNINKRFAELAEENVNLQKEAVKRQAEIDNLPAQKKLMETELQNQNLAFQLKMQQEHSQLMAQGYKDQLTAKQSFQQVEHDVNLDYHRRQNNNQKEYNEVVREKKRAHEERVLEAGYERRNRLHAAINDFNEALIPEATEYQRLMKYTHFPELVDLNDRLRVLTDRKTEKRNESLHDDESPQQNEEFKEAHKQWKIVSEAFDNYRKTHIPQFNDVENYLLLDNIKAVSSWTPEQTANFLIEKGHKKLGDKFNEIEKLHYAEQKDSEFKRLNTFDKRVYGDLETMQQQTQEENADLIFQQTTGQPRLVRRREQLPQPEAVQQEEEEIAEQPGNQ
jgi:hypothetical protein